MKELFLIILVVLYDPTILLPQDKTVEMSRIYKTWITLKNNPKKLKGVLHEIQDSSILVSNSLFKADYANGSFDTQIINYNNVAIIRTRVNGSKISGTLIGAGLGFLFGLILTSADIDVNEIPGSAPGNNYMENGLLLAIPGTLAGFIIGSIKISIPINGDFHTFNENKSRLRKYSNIR